MDNSKQVNPKEELIKLYQFVNFSIITESNEDELQTILKKVIDILVMEETAHPEVFQVFFQFYPPLFLNLLESTNHNINFCLLQQMAFLLPNLKNKSNLIMFMSMTFMTRLIKDVSKKQNDEDYISHYINFLKYLSFNINESTFYFFYNKETLSFPLLDSCLLLYNHTDPLVKNVSRHIILTILKLNNDDCIRYLCSLPSVSYFLLLAKQTKLHINTLIQNKGKDQQERNTLLEDIQNDIIFMQDVFNIGIEKINYLLINVYFGELIIPCLLFLLGKEKVNSKENNFYSFEIVLYVLWLFVYYIKEKSFLNMLCLLMFSDNIIKAVTSEKQIEIETDKIIEIFDGELDVDGTFEYFLMRNHSTSLIQLLSQNKEEELFQIYHNIEFFDFVRSLQKVRTSHNKKDIVNMINNEINTKLKRQSKNTDKITRVHNIISKLTGFVIGMSDSNAYMFSAIQLMKQKFPFVKKEGITNEVKLKFIDILCSFKLYSQNVVMYLCLIIFQLLHKEQGCIDDNLLFDLNLKGEISSSIPIIDINSQYDFSNMNRDYSKLENEMTKCKNNININNKIKDEIFHFIYKQRIIQKQEINIQEYLINSITQNPAFLTPFTLNIIYQCLLILPFQNQATKLIYTKTAFKEIVKHIKNELSNKENNYFIFKYTLHIFKHELTNYQKDISLHLKKLISDPLFSLNDPIDYQSKLQNQFLYPPYVNDLLHYRTLLYHFFTHMNLFNKPALLYLQSSSMFNSNLQSGNSIKKEILMRDKIDVLEVQFYRESKVIDNVDYKFENLFMFIYKFMLCFGDGNISAEDSFFIKYCFPIWSIDISKDSNKKEIKVIVNVDLDDLSKNEIILINFPNKKKLDTMYDMLNNEILVGYIMQYEIITSLFEGIH